MKMDGLRQDGDGKKKSDTQKAEAIEQLLGTKSLGIATARVVELLHICF